MSDSEEQQQEPEKLSQPQWPENGEDWSDEEDGTNMDCGLLQAMAEEDEEINVYNEETFGMDLDTHGTTEDPSSGLLQFAEPPLSPPTPPPPPDPKPPSHHSSPSPPRHKPQYVPRTLPWQRGRGRGQRGGLGRGQMFEDPAVMRIVQGRPSLKGLDSAIVDCGNTMNQNTFEDDEYYRRIEAKMAEEELGIRGKREPPKLTTPYIMKTDSYTPVVHIEGSLGQVAVSTCYSPRRAISAVHAVQAHGPLEEQKDIRQQRLEILSKIEKLFIVLLEVEETERMKTTVLSEAEQRRLMEKTQRKVEHIYSQLQHHNPLDSGGEFLPFMLVSKGKRLVARLLPFLKHDTALKILRIVTSNLPTLMSRDTEEALPVLYPPLRNVIGGLTFSQLIKVLKDLTAESLTTYESLTLACQNKFGLSLLYALLSQGEKLLSSGVPLEPSIGDFETWTDTIFQVAGQLSQCSLVEPLLLPSNLLTLFCRYLDKRTVHQLKSNMEEAKYVRGLGGLRVGEGLENRSIHEKKEGRLRPECILDPHNQVHMMGQLLLQSVVILWLVQTAHTGGYSAASGVANGHGPQPNGGRPQNGGGIGRMLMPSKGVGQAMGAQNGYGGYPTKGVGYGAAAGAANGGGVKGYGATAGVNNGQGGQQQGRSLC
ncbi:Protein PAT1 -like protein 2 PAT1-like protein 2 [Collichthys lucidus]|uniref:Protein PAT1-like protein 2 PAT1-like protein 2 n=1 Tax=Collichthys lucidus TaxID=240159 RepID=A0A4U5VRG6_COLLU|nr:Protein PAT1 -like protein 2 PAT1-like protein 2 [Collichthys lucidus]